MHEIILSKINNEVKLGNKVALAIITDVQGSSPGKQGATLAYFSDGSTFGTVGGGILEHEIINKCKVCLESGEDTNFNHSLIKSSNDLIWYLTDSLEGPPITLRSSTHVTRSIAW